MSIEKAYNTWSEQYDTNKNRTRDLDQKATIATLSRYTFTNVLELGCGTGKNTQWLITKAQQIIGVDFSQGMLDIAAQKINNSKVQFQKADLNQTWDLPDNWADLITISLTLEHIHNLNHIFSEAVSKLKKGGYLFISELHPFKQYLGSKARYETADGTQELEEYVHHITEYLQCAQETGFKLVELKEWFDEPDDSGVPRLITFVFQI